MLSINMRIFKTVLLITFFGASAWCLPVSDVLKTEAPSLIPSTMINAGEPTSTRLDTDYYDQRQNGTENYRIQVDGVVLVFAPVDALLLAGTDGATSTTESNLSIADHGGSIHINVPNQSDKPSVDVHNRTESASSKMIHR